MKIRLLLLISVLLAVSSSLLAESAKPDRVHDHVYNDVYDYANRDGTPLRLYLFAPVSVAKPTAPSPVVLLFHSGGWVRGKPEWLFEDAQRFAALGLAAIPVQYRLSTNGITPVDALADTCAAFDWVRSHAALLNIDPARVIGYGASAGGQLVVAAATVGCPQSDIRPAALILFSAGVDTANSAQFRRLVGANVNPVDYSPLAHVDERTPPTLIIHGAEDSVTRLPASEQFCARIRQAGGQCQLHAFPKLGHLLTRQLDDQRTSIDADPQAVLKAQQLQALFLQKQGYAVQR